MHGWLRVNHLPGGFVFVREAALRTHSALSVRGRTIELRHAAVIK